jgi:phosphatidylinositol phospholipase C, delta
MQDIVLTISKEDKQKPQYVLIMASKGIKSTLSPKGLPKAAVGALTGTANKGIQHIVKASKVPAEAFKSSPPKEEWTQTTFPATVLQQALSTIEVNPVLLDGIHVQKVTGTGRRVKRVLTLSKDKCAIFVTHSKINKAKGTMAMVASSLPIPLWTPSKGFSFSSDKSYRDRYTRYIDVADLDSVQVGVVGTQKLETACQRGYLGSEERYLSSHQEEIVTIYHHGAIPLDLLIPDQSLRRDLIKALADIQNMYHEIQRWIRNDSLLLRYVWYDVDVDGNGMISNREFNNICNRINLYLKDGSKRFSNFLKSKNITDRKEITYLECMELLDSVKGNLPANELWKSLFGDAAKVSAKELTEKFLQGTQGETNSTIEDGEALLQSLNTLVLEGDEPVADLTKAQFHYFLHSVFNDAYDPVKKELVGKLDKPISYYWINTSHNTYLTGDQLKSRSSVEAYAKSLERGCKCLELDCWDGTKEGNEYVPVVFHGHTLTSKIEFKEICLVVASYLKAHPDTYPIILSLENHCSHPFQKAMASHMSNIFGNKLYVPSEEDTKGALPSPESLKGMIIIKGKRPPEPDAGKEEEAEKEEKEDEEDPYEQAKKGSNADAKPSKIVPELAKLTLFHGTKWKSFDKSIELPHSHMHSIGETKIGKIIDKQVDNAELWRKYNVDHMTRTYPAGFRVDSSNYHPLVAWAVGSQLVALNFQTHDTPLLLNDGRFHENGGCGYVLKPDSVMGGEKPKDQKIKIRVLSGHCLPKPEGAKVGETIDPYVTVELHDIKVSSSGKEELVQTSHSTKAIDDNGFCPNWNDKGTEFTVKNTDVAMFQFSLMDSDVDFDDRVAVATIPVSCLRKGYRSVQLDDHRNTRSGAFRYATLLVEVS